MLVTLLLLLTAPQNVVVVEARVPGEEPRPALGAELANALGTSNPTQSGAVLAQRLPAVTTSGKAEPMIEADRLVARGKDAYLEGRFAQATNDLERAREVLSQVIESFDEERKAAEALFQAYMYLAFTLHHQGGNYIPQATEILKDAIRTFPSIEPSFNEYGPENLKFYRQVRTEMDQGPMAQLHVEAGRDPASVYLNGRLVGVTPLDLKRIYPGHYRLHVRRGAEASRVHDIEARPGENQIRVDADFDQVVRTDGQVAFIYSNASVRKARHQHDGAAVARLLAARGALIYWRDGWQEHLVFVDIDGNARKADTTPAEAAHVATELCAGRTGEFVQGDSDRPTRIWTWIVGGVGVGAVVMGIILGQSASSDFDTLTARYPSGLLDSAGSDLRASGNTKQTAANVVIGVGTTSIVGAVFLYWYEGRGTRAERAQFVPVIDRSFAGAQLRVEF